MIVFSATHNLSGKIFIGSGRNSIESTWGQLLAQAEQGVAGEFFALIRRDGAEAFSLDEWGLAETPRELRELLHDAKQDLGGELIKSGRVKAPAIEKARKIDATTLKELCESGGEPALEEPLEDWLAVRRELQSKRDSNDARPAEDSLAAEKLDATPVSGRCASAAKEKRIKEAIVRERSARQQYRQTRSTEDAAEMCAVIAAIEGRRLAGKKKPQKASAKAAVSKGVKEVARAVKPRQKADRLAAGRTGSSSKEKRIKQAIEAEKALRDAEKRSKAAAQADEMAEILARLDTRNKEAAKVRRRR